MEYGFVYFCRDLHRVPEITRLAAQQGFKLLGFCDSPALAFDPYVGLTLAALEDTKLRLGPGVTNPQTRHPIVLANLAAALEELAPGRSFVGIATGNSGVHHAGTPPAGIRGLAEAADAVRRLVQGETVELGGARLRISQSSGNRVPIVIAGSGERMLRTAGGIADGVWVNVGVTPERVAEAIRWVEEGAEAAGRDPDSVEVWVFSVAAIDEDRSRALDEAKSGAIGVAKYVLRADALGKRLPPELEPTIDRLVDAYEYGEHLTPGHSANYELAEQLGLGDYLLDRFAIAGDHDDCKRKLEALREVGVERVCFSFSAAPDIAPYIRGFGERVLLGSA